MTLTVWLSLFTISLLGAMSPGPSLAIVTKHALASGRSYGIAVAWSHALGIGIYAFITIIGLSVVMTQAPLIFKGITIAGALYLAYLGVNALRSKGGVADRLASGEQAPLGKAMREGFLISILSPKIMLFFTALFSQFVAVANDTANKVIIVSTPFLVDGLWYTLIAFLLTRPKVIGVLQSKAVLIDRVSGLVLILLALRVIFTV